VENGWVETDNPNLHGKGGAGAAAAMDIDEMQDIDGGGEAEQEGEAADMDELMKQQDDKKDDNVFSKYVVRNQEDDEELVHRNRTYDLSITYDFFYQTPRLWLIGYSECGQVLSESEIFEDIMADYAKKTVTLEPHPHLGVKQASIHPCNHANVMKKIIDTIVSNGGTPQVHQSLFVFLKFISSVVPTIEYDFTIDLELE
jgi:ubiquitin-like-conjugating enzyme ATG3